MEFKKPAFDKPITGCGIAKVGEKSFTLALSYKNAKGKVEEDTFSFKKNDLPDTLPEQFEIESGKKYFASITTDGKQLLNIRPAKGTFKVKCVKFSETKDGDILVVKRNGDYGEYFQFVPLVTVQSGNAKGIDFPTYLPLGSDGKPRLTYNDDGLMVVMGDPDKSKAIQALYDFLTYTGVADVDINYPVDGDSPDDDPQAVLGTLFKAIRKQNKVFTILVADGYVKAMAEDEDVMEDEDGDEEEEVKPKAKAKSSPKNEILEEEDDEEKPIVKAKRKPKFD